MMMEDPLNMEFADVLGMENPTASLDQFLDMPLDSETDLNIFSQNTPPYTPPSSPPELIFAPETSVPTSLPTSLASSNLPEVDQALFSDPAMLDQLPEHPILPSALPDANILDPSKDTNMSNSKSDPKKKPRKRRRQDPANMSPTELQEHLLKKQIRMMKNRESASLSRKKKKEYLESLERKVKEQDEENRKLKERVRQLEEENNSLRHRMGVSPKTAAIATTALLACFLCFSFTFPTTSTTTLSSPFTTGRSLKSIFKPQSPVSEPLRLTHVPSLGGLKPASDSSLQNVKHPPRPILDAPLKKFLLDHQKKVMRQLNDTVLSPVAETTALVTSNGELIESEPPLFRVDDELRTSMLHNIQRKSDTSYIFCTQVQVVSASERRDEPKVAIVMPTPTTTITSDDEATINIVQIDCDVVGTNIIATARHNTTVDAA